MFTVTMTKKWKSTKRVIQTADTVYTPARKTAPKEKENNKVLDDNSNSEKKIEQNYGRFTGNLTQESIFDFMEFEEIVDIIDKSGILK